MSFRMGNQCDVVNFWRYAYRPVKIWKYGQFGKIRKTNEIDYFEIIIGVTIFT